MALPREEFGLPTADGGGSGGGLFEAKVKETVSQTIGDMIREAAKTVALGGETWDSYKAENPLMQLFEAKIQSLPDDVVISEEHQYTASKEVFMAAAKEQAKEIFAQSSDVFYGFIENPQATVDSLEADKQKIREDGNKTENFADEFIRQHVERRQKVYDEAYAANSHLGDEGARLEALAAVSKELAESGELQASAEEGQIEADDACLEANFEIARLQEQCVIFDTPAELLDAIKGLQGDISEIQSLKSQLAAAMKSGNLVSVNFIKGQINQKTQATAAKIDEAQDKIGDSASDKAEAYTKAHEAWLEREFGGKGYDTQTVAAIGNFYRQSGFVEQDRKDEKILGRKHVEERRQATAAVIHKEHQTITDHAKLTPDQQQAMAKEFGGITQRLDRLRDQLIASGAEPNKALAEAFEKARAEFRAIREKYSVPNAIFYEQLREIQSLLDKVEKGEITADVAATQLIQQAKAAGAKIEQEYKVLEEQYILALPEAMQDYISEHKDRLLKMTPAEVAAKFKEIEADVASGKRKREDLTTEDRAISFIHRKNQVVGNVVAMKAALSVAIGEDQSLAKQRAQMDPAKRAQLDNEIALQREKFDNAGVNVAAKIDALKTIATVNHMYGVIDDKALASQMKALDNPHTVNLFRESVKAGKITNFESLGSFEHGLDVGTIAKSALNMTDEQRKAYRQEVELSNRLTEIERAVHQETDKLAFEKQKAYLDEEYAQIAKLGGAASLPLTGQDTAPLDEGQAATPQEMLQERGKAIYREVYNQHYLTNLKKAHEQEKDPAVQASLKTIIDKADAAGNKAVSEIQHRDGKKGLLFGDRIELKEACDKASVQDEKSAVAVDIILAEIKKVQEEKQLQGDDARERLKQLESQVKQKIEAAPGLAEEQKQALLNTLEASRDEQGNLNPDVLKTNLQHAASTGKATEKGKAGEPRGSNEAAVGGKEQSAKSDTTLVRNVEQQLQNGVPPSPSAAAKATVAAAVLQEFVAKQGAEIDKIASLEVLKGVSPSQVASAIVSAAAAHAAHPQPQIASVLATALTTPAALQAVQERLTQLSAKEISGVATPAEQKTLAALESISKLQQQLVVANTIAATIEHQHQAAIASKTANAPLTADQIVQRTQETLKVIGVDRVQFLGKEISNVAAALSPQASATATATTYSKEAAKPIVTEIAAEVKAAVEKQQQQAAKELAAMAAEKSAKVEPTPVRVEVAAPKQAPAVAPVAAPKAEPVKVVAEASKPAAAVGTATAQQTQAAAAQALTSAAAAAAPPPASTKPAAAPIAVANATAAADKAKPAATAPAVATDSTRGTDVAASSSPAKVIRTTAAAPVPAEPAVSSVPTRRNPDVAAAINDTLHSRGASGLAAHSPTSNIGGAHPPTRHVTMIAGEPTKVGLTVTSPGASTQVVTAANDAPSKPVVERDKGKAPDQVAAAARREETARRLAEASAKEEAGRVAAVPSGSATATDPHLTTPARVANGGAVISPVAHTQNTSDANPLFHAAAYSASVAGDTPTKPAGGVLASLAQESGVAKIPDCNGRPCTPEEVATQATPKTPEARAAQGAQKA